MSTNLSDSKTVIKDGQKVNKLRPFCYINNVYHQLEYRDVLRFVHTNTPDDDIDFNDLWIKYQEDIMKLETILSAYIVAGCSYELIYNLFSKGGGNNEIIRKGKEKEMKFQLYK